MAHTFSIKRSDRSGTWYLTPGTKSIYDLQISNDSKSATDCSLVLEQPASGVSVEPRVLSLRGHEVRTVTVIFAADALLPVSRRVVMTVRDASDTVQATFAHPVSLTGEGEPLVPADKALDLPLFSGRPESLTSGEADAARGTEQRKRDDPFADEPPDKTQLALTFPAVKTVSEAAVPPTAANAGPEQPGAVAPPAPQPMKDPISRAVSPTYRSVYSPRPVRAGGHRRVDMLMIALALVGIVLGAILFKPVSLHALPSLARSTLYRAIAQLQPKAAAKPKKRRPSTHQRSISTRVIASSLAPASVVSAPPHVASKPVPAIKPNAKQTLRVAAMKARVQGVVVSPPLAAAQHALSNVAAPAAPPADPTALSPAQRRSAALTALNPKPRNIIAGAGPVVSAEGLQARYASLGRVVRADWSASGQSSANVALIDQRGALLNSLTVAGTQQSARVPLPLQYHSSVVVQLTSTGRFGERVVQTLTLPPYSR